MKLIASLNFACLEVYACFYDAPVGEHTVDVEEQPLEGFGSLAERVVHGARIHGSAVEITL